MRRERSAGFTFFWIASMDPEVAQKLMDAGPEVLMAPGLLNRTDEIDEVTPILRKATPT